MGIKLERGAIVHNPFRVNCWSTYCVLTGHSFTAAGSTFVPTESKISCYQAISLHKNRTSGKQRLVFPTCFKIFFFYIMQQKESLIEGRLIDRRALVLKSLEAG